jgi:hypothetical protein
MTSSPSGYEQWIGDGPPLIAAQAGLLPAVAGRRALRRAASPGSDVPAVAVPPPLIAFQIGLSRPAGR